MKRKPEKPRNSKPQNPVLNFMKTFNKCLFSLLILSGPLGVQAQYFHGFHSDYSIIGNGVQTELPIFKANNYGALIGGIGTTVPGTLADPSPMAICIDHDGNSVFDYTYLYTSCGTQIHASSSRILQLNHTTQSLCLVSTFTAPDDACNTYTNSQTGVVQPGYIAGGVMYQSLNLNGWLNSQQAYVFMTNNIPTWDVYDLEITDVQKAVNNPANDDVYVVGNLRYGYEQKVMFAFKFDANGNALWHKTYAIGYGFSDPSAHGIVQSPYNPDEVYIVGDINQVYPNQPTGDGFIMTVDANTGAVVTNNTYDIGNTEGFNAIAVSDDPQSPGFVLCGYSNTNAGTNGKYWVVKTDQYLNIEWNKTYSDTGSFDICEAKSIKGRYSSTYGRYEYYVAGREGAIPSDVMVLKLDQDGNPLNAGGGGIFIYDEGGDGEYAVSIDASNVAGANGEGLGIFCYHNDVMSKSNALAIHAAFNGYTGCNESYYIAAATDESSTPEYLWAGDNEGWMPYTVVQSGIIANYGANACYTPTAPSGSNAKPGSTTGINTTAYTEGEIELAPNPATDYLDVKNVTNAGYIITNSIGQKVYSGKIENGNTKIDVNTLEPGMYFITIIQKEQKKQLKFVKE